MKNRLHCDAQGQFTACAIFLKFGTRILRRPKNPTAKYQNDLWSIFYIKNKTWISCHFCHGNFLQLVLSQNVYKLFIVQKNLSLRQDFDFWALPITLYRPLHYPRIRVHCRLDLPSWKVLITWPWSDISSKSSLPGSKTGFWIS